MKNLRRMEMAKGVKREKAEEREGHGESSHITTGVTKGSVLQVGTVIELNRNAISPDAKGAKPVR